MKQYDRVLVSSIPEDEYETTERDDPCKGCDFENAFCDGTLVPSCIETKGGMVNDYILKEKSDAKTS